MALTRCPHCGRTVEPEQVTQVHVKPDGQHPYWLAVCVICHPETAEDEIDTRVGQGPDGFRA